MKGVQADGQSAERRKLYEDGAVSGGAEEDGSVTDYNLAKDS
jgi:hypothetical protein